MKSKWIELVKQKIKEIKKEGKLTGRNIMKEAIKRAKEIYKKQKGASEEKK